VSNACCHSRSTGFFVRLTSSRQKYDCAPVFMEASDKHLWESSASKATYTPRSMVVDAWRHEVSWSDKVALVFRRFWPENAALTLHNDVVSLLVTWEKAAAALGEATLAAPMPGAAQAVTLDTHTSAHHNRLRRVYEELQLGGLLDPSSFPNATVCYRRCLIGSGLFNFNGMSGMRTMRTTPGDMEAVKRYLRAALVLPPPMPRMRVSRVAYLPRTVSRRIVNVEEMLVGIGEAGFEVHVISELECAHCTLRQQLSALWDADVVISIHGAALAYAAFTDAEAVVEIMPYGFRKEAFYAASAASGKEHYQVYTSKRDTQLDLASLPKPLQHALNGLRASNASLYALLVEQHRCPAGVDWSEEWAHLCRAGIMYQDSRVDVGKLVFLLDMIRQRARKYDNAYFRQQSPPATSGRIRGR